MQIARAARCVCIGMAAFSLLAFGQTNPKFKARLAMVPIDAAMIATVAGSGTVAAELVGATLSIQGSFEGLRSPATTVQIHVGPRGERGPALLQLTISQATHGTIRGSLQLMPAQVDALKAGRLYIQVNSQKAPAPDGNLWGWLLPVEAR